MNAGQERALKATSYDEHDNPIADVTDVTTFAGPGMTCNANRCSATKTGEYTVTGTHDGLTDDIDLTVTPGHVARQFVLSPAATTISAGETVEFTATAYDVYGNVVGDINHLATFTSPDMTCEANRCTSTETGAHVVTVSAVNGFADSTALVFVTPGPTDQIVLSTDTTTIDTGQTAELTATAFDEYGNEVGDVTESTTFTSTAPGTCRANACGSTQPGTMTVTGSYVIPSRATLARPVALAAAPGDIVTATATLTVRATGNDPGNDPGTDDNAGGGGSGDPTATGEGAGRGDSVPGALPVTGAEVTWWQAATGILLLFTGAAVLVGTRRRRVVPTP